MVILKHMQGGSIMKIVVSAEGKSLDSDVDPRFGGSAGFVLFVGFGSRHREILIEKYSLYRIVKSNR